MDLQKMRSLSSLNMDIQEMREAKLDKHWKAKGVVSSFTRVYVVTSGCATLEFDHKSVDILPGYVYVVPAGLEFSYSCSESCEKYYFHLTLLMPDGQDVFRYVKDCIIIEDTLAKDIISRSFNLDTVDSLINIKSFLYSVVSKCLNKIDNIPVKKYSDFVMNIISYIDNNLSSNLTVEEIAQVFFCSGSKVRKTFKDQTGISIGKYISDKVMYSAEAQLRMTQKPIRDISENLGFCDQFYFSRCFSLKYGISPVKYRKECQRFG